MVYLGVCLLRGMHEIAYKSCTAGPVHAAIYFSIKHASNI